MEKQNSGALSAAFAFLLWGLLPVFWKQLNDLPKITVFYNRSLWSLIFLAILLLKRDGFFHNSTLFKENWRNLLLSALFLMANWVTYIYAVSSNLLLEASLGYFICPLTSMTLGIVILKEKPTFYLLCAMAFAFCGIALRMMQNASFPWVSLGLAFSFSFYSLVSKQKPIDSLSRLGFESFFMVLVTSLYLLFIREPVQVNFAPDWKNQILCILSGPITFLPLVFYGLALKNLPLSKVGIFQYICPSVIFLIGLFVYNEELDTDDLASFLLIWTGIAIYFISSKLRNRNAYLELKRSN